MSVDWDSYIDRHYASILIYSPIRAIYTYIGVYVCVYMYIYVYICKYMYIYTIIFECTLVCD